MYTTKYLLSTIKEKPAHTESISHQLMLRSGMIRKLSSGIYTWLPTGYRIIKKVIKIISNIMNQHGYLEICMPVIQPKSLWDHSGRAKLYGEELMNITNRRKKKYILSPTNEEVVTYIFSQEINSHKQLPIVFYQIQKKFRDEIRPRFGVIRSIEFFMKDAYSFHINKKSLQQTYETIKELYIKIFNYFKLHFKIVKSNSKMMGGSLSHEFHAITNIGEDEIIFSETSNYAVPSSKFNQQENKIKTYLLKTKSDQSKYTTAILLIRENDPINVQDLENIPVLSSPIRFITSKSKKLSYQWTNFKDFCINKRMFVIAESKIINLPYFVFHTHRFNKKLTPIVWNKKIIFNKIITMNNIDNVFYYKTKSAILKKKNSVEIGHIFQIGKKYSKDRNFLIQDKYNKNKLLYMGCYGIGINRILSSVIEQNHDNHGIIWPLCIAPFQVFIIPINMHKCKKIKEVAKSIYKKLIHEKIDVLFDNRKESIGKIFADMNLIGIPYGIIISQNTIKSKEIEFYCRKKNQKTRILISMIIGLIKTIIKTKNL
ncbi:proline--tRNA ligase [Buchnera aphidicola]|uniref:proline--tRNA ligase n=1 Tax=Buchnera aphidicola TaxID=9 RepID=UPI00094C5BC1|nr:proline--tRNA ligase [Buchnera aphidicola]